MKTLRFLCIGFAAVVGMAMGATRASADNLTFTCAASIDATQAGTCAYLNSTISSLYTSTFSNVNANIYIQQGITGLGSSTPGFYNYVPYSTYLADLTATASNDAVDVAALAALNSLDTPLYGSGNVVITSALGEAIGVPNADLFGTTSGGAACIIGTAGCYNGIITITTPANLYSETGQLLYWNQTGGAQPGNAYDFYSVVEHETDEILGTRSCIATTSGALSNPCNYFGSGTPSAVDLFRYSALGTLIPDSSLSTTPGAYFSYNGGATNGAGGAVYNTLANGEDYADFASYCKFVQDATGCPGSDLNITTDGGAEINILDAVGYNVTNVTNVTPEPSSMALFATGLLGIGLLMRKR
jgi:PEP-CTERM motif